MLRSRRHGRHRSRVVSSVAVGLTVSGLVVGSLLGSGGAAVYGVQAPPPERSSGGGYAERPVVPVGDLNGDHRRDLVVMTQTGDADHMVTTVTARSGRTGRPLWSRRLTTTYGAVAAYPAAGVGSAGPGVVIVATQTPGSASDLVAYGVTGAGRTAWTHVESGSTDSTGIHDAPDNMGLVEDHGGAALMIVRLSTTVLLTGPVDASNQPVYVDAATGRARPVGSAFSVSSGYAAVTTAPDVTGDGTDEVVAIEHATDADHETMTLRDGASGADLWTTDVPGNAPTLTYVQDVGDVDGDGHEDLAEQGFDETSDGSYGQLPATVIDGATGRVWWSRPGYAEEIGGHVHAVLLLDAAPVEAVRADGSVLWRSAGESSDVLGAGDVDGDGSFDQAFSVGATDRLVSTRAGRVLWSGPAAAGTPVGASIDRHGDDLVSVTRRGTTATVVPHSGSTGRALWHVKVTGLRTDPTVQAEDVTGDGCADVLLDDGTTVRALGGANGAPLWTLTLASGHLARGRAPAHC